MMNTESENTNEAKKDSKFAELKQWKGPFQLERLQRTLLQQQSQNSALKKVLGEAGSGESTKAELSKNKKELQEQINALKDANLRLADRVDLAKGRDTLNPETFKANENGIKKPLKSLENSERRAFELHDLNNLNRKLAEQSRERHVDASESLKELTGTARKEKIIELKTQAVKEYLTHKEAILSHPERRSSIENKRDLKLGDSYMRLNVFKKIYQSVLKTYYKAEMFGRQVWNSDSKFKELKSGKFDQGHTLERVKLNREAQIKHFKTVNAEKKITKAAAKSTTAANRPLIVK